MRLFGLAFVLGLSLTLAPLAAEAQRPGKVYQVASSLNRITAAITIHGRTRVVNLAEHSFNAGSGLSPQRSGTMSLAVSASLAPHPERLTCFGLRWRQRRSGV
jgi:hypothetical protein